MQKTTPKADKKSLFNQCFWLHAAGIIFVGLGFVGMALPVMPTTVFFILALACFTRSSPKFAQWLLEHPKFGPSLQAWHHHRVIPRKGKVGAALGMSIGFTLLWLKSPSAWILLSVALIEIVVLIYIFSKPSAAPIDDTSDLT